MPLPVANSINWFGAAAVRNFARKRCGASCASTSRIPKARVRKNVRSSTFPSAWHLYVHCILGEVRSVEASSFFWNRLTGGIGEAISILRYPWSAMRPSLCKRDVEFAREPAHRIIGNGRGNIWPPYRIRAILLFQAESSGDIENILVWSFR